MDIEKIKNTAKFYAEKFVENEKICFEFETEPFTTKEWYTILRLAQVYYNLIKGIYTREKAIQEQKATFDFVNEHADLFE